MHRIYNITLSGIVFLLSACGNPGGISDADYNKYKQLGAPKILYSCTYEISPDFTEMRDCILNGDSNESCESSLSAKQTNVGYAAGIGIQSTYNKLVKDAMDECKNEFKVLESQQYAIEDK